MKFLLHIGSPKAGSSFLQTLCALSRAELAAAGVFFPHGTAHDEAAMQQGRISGGNAWALARQISAGRWTEVEHSLTRASKTAAAQNCDRVLLSSEWLLGSLAHGKRLEEFVAVLRQSGGHTLELFLLLREPVGQLISHYRHRAKSGALYDLKTWTERDYLLPSRLGSIRRQLEATGVAITVRAYSKAPGVLQQMFFSDWLGVPLPTQASDQLVNPSLSLSELVLLRQLRAKHPGLVPFLYERLSAVDPALKSEVPAMQDYAHRVASRAVAQYAEEWHYWNAVLPENERFDIHGPDQPAGPEPAELLLSAAQWDVLVALMADATRPRFVLALLWTAQIRPLLARAKRALLRSAPRR